MSAHPLGRDLPGGCLDTLEVEPSGLIRLVGWSALATPDFSTLRVISGGAELQPLQHFRVRRPDVAQALGKDDPFLGFALEYRLRAPSLRLELSGQPVLDLPAVHFALPDYHSLFDDITVFGRERIYTSGPPDPNVNPDVLALAQRLPGPVLDFGCGSGALVAALRAGGAEAQGLELDRHGIREGLNALARPFVQLYAGGFPLPYADGAFESAVCTEVLEHIPDFRAALRELSRVTRRQVLLTVPDLSSVPLLFPHGVVPWHLLEGTHLHFFNQSSLQHELRELFTRVSFLRAGELYVNGTRFYTSVVALCLK